MTARLLLDVLPVLLALLGAAHALGHLFARLRQPRVIGEVLGGLLVGPSVVGLLSPGLAAALHEAPLLPVALEALYSAGLVLLMFLSGVGMKGLLTPEDRGPIAWLAAIGTCLPFLITLALAPLLPLDALLGAAGHRLSLLLVLAIAAAVTSIPVISRIFHDLGLLETRFARIVLGVAVLEDIALWLVLAVALSLAASNGLPGDEVGTHLALTVAYVVAALGLLPRAARAIGAHPWNVLARRAPAGWMLLVLGACCALAHAAGVSLIFASLFAGLAVASDANTRWPTSTRRLERASFATLIPIYFAIVGWRLDLVDALWPVATAALIVAACAVKLASVALGARLAGFRGPAIVNLSVAMNARGGPGIVLASVAHDAGIVNAPGYTALIALALVTSQAAGFWLERIVRRGGSLLGEPPPASG